MSQSSPAPTLSRSIYGFVVYLLFSCIFVFYFIWAFVPSEYFEFIGITELPDKYFALFLPVLVLTATTIFAFFIYPSLSLIMTTNIDSVYTVKDESSIVRCSHVDRNGIICDNKIILDTQLQSWRTKLECEDHRNHEKTIASFCDCFDKSQCKLTEDYLDNVRKLQNKRDSANDLSIFQVSKILYE